VDHEEDAVISGGLAALPADSAGIPRAREKRGEGETREARDFRARSVRKSIFQAALRENAQRLSRTCLTDGIQTPDSGNTGGEHARARTHTRGIRQDIGSADLAAVEHVRHSSSCHG